MYKKLNTFFFIIIFLFSFQSFGYAQKLPSFPSDKILKYSIPDVPQTVKSVKIISKGINRKTDSLEIFTIQQFSFSRNGKLEKVNFIDPSSNEIHMTHFFDSNGRIKSQKRSKNSWYPFIKYLYKENQNQSEEICFSSDSTIVKKTLLQYDSLNKKRLIRKRYRDKNTLADSTVYKYDVHGNLVYKLFYNTKNGYGIHLDSTITGGEEEFDPWADDTTKYVYQYNSAGKVTKKTKYLVGDPYRQYIYYAKKDTQYTVAKGYRKFEEKWITKEISKKLDSTKIQLIYLHDSYFDDIKKIFHSGRLDSVIRFKNASVTNRIGYTYEFSYNKHRQWLKRSAYKNGKLYKIEIRIFTYW